MMIDAPTATYDKRRVGGAMVTFFVLLCLFRPAADALGIHLGRCHD